MMRKIIYIMLFSSFCAFFSLLTAFVVAKAVYNFNNGKLFYQVDLLLFFRDFDVKDIQFFFLIFSIVFIITYLRYRDY
ncbi:hypothetical protein A9298_04190 [Haemophilus parainfluenzae]|nr:hypothetical protein A9298_04190 [Haemophilus parainfluenzae]